MHFFINIYIHVAAFQKKKHFLNCIFGVVRFYHRFVFLLHCLKKSYKDNQPSQLTIEDKTIVCNCNINSLKYLFIKTFVIEKLNA